MKNLFLAGILLAYCLAFCACQNAKTDTKDSTNTITTPIPEPVITKDTSSSKAGAMSAALQEVLASYLELKNAFTADNASAAAIVGRKLQKQLTDVNTASFPKDKVDMFLDLQSDAIEHADHIGVNAGHIKHQRVHFAPLSKDIYTMVKAFGSNQPLYYEYCPMYNDGKDGYWLSQSKEISNPYMGKAMPKCGVVKEEL
ncbi:MAG: DUF3347 domain-containing protein [Saprospiraceae bacterium]